MTLHDCCTSASGLLIRWTAHVNLSPEAQSGAFRSDSLKVAIQSPVACVTPTPARCSWEQKARASLITANQCGQAVGRPYKEPLCWLVELRSIEANGSPTNRKN